MSRSLRIRRMRLTQRILNRLASGKFAEQFKDQLRLVLHLDAAAAFAAARGAAASSRPHVRRYAEWVLAHYGRMTASLAAEIGSWEG